MKEFCVSNWDDVILVCLDDKVIVFVGELGIFISIGVRGYNKVLIFLDGLKLVCIDYDFYIVGLVLFVVFVFRIFWNSNDSFFKGNVYIIIKDKVF